MKKLLVALAVGVAVFAAAYASAATLGLTSDNLGSDDQVVASCDTSVVVTYQTSYHATTTAAAAGAYLVDTVTLEGLDQTACNGQTISVTLSGDTNVVTPSSSTASLIELEKACCTGSGGSEVLSLTTHAVGTPVDVNAEAVQGIHVVITGP